MLFTSYIQSNETTCLAIIQTWKLALPENSPFQYSTVDEFEFKRKKDRNEKRKRERENEIFTTCCLASNCQIKLQCQAVALDEVFSFGVPRV